MNVSYHSPVVAYESCSTTPPPPTTRASLTLLHHRPLSLSVSLYQNPNFLTGNTIFVKMQRFCSVAKVRTKHFGVMVSSKVAEVMESVDRALFVPSVSAAPYDDTPVAIGYNATISAPHMHATCLQLLEENLQPGMHALDIGSGTGYLTACFAVMVGPQGRAVGVEHIPELVSLAIENIQKSAAATLLKDGSLSVHVGGMISKISVNLKD